MPLENHLAGLNAAQENLIYESIREYCNIAKIDIASLYDIWKAHRRGTGHKNGYAETGFISLNTISSTFRKAIPPTAYCYGIDFPYWIDLNTNKQKIFVVGINANRKMADWKNFGKVVNEEGNEVLVNSAWGANNNFHFDKDYCNFFSALSDCNFSFYFTDLQKLFFWWNFEATKYNSYRHKSFVAATFELSKEILNKEIAIIRPDVIIAFGNIVPNALGISKGLNVTKEKIRKQEYNHIPFYHLPHIGKSVRENNIKDFYKANSIAPEKWQNGKGNNFASIFIQGMQPFEEN